ncbi:protein FAR1-RELATED SEQUENCE 5-like isoform X2 [Andrographis paniculata]|uniref:protein FAR1-RELATED SEQUENCE 5-like isoform X2 n=1 Tax=Andrographis paniculata TaxID=175694 RepID=UPI0021E80494|nr:protein FAR1-RELATED SEQUENCE 5-like isoform X2 [Andrographis paniculata]
MLKSAEGKREVDRRSINVRTPRPITRFDCKATMKIRLKENMKYQIIEFVSEHTHQLTCPQETHACRGQRRINDAHVVHIDIGLAPRVSHDFIVEEVGGQDSLGFIKQDCKNYLCSKRTKYMEIGDVGGILEYLQEMQCKDPKFSYFIQVDEDDKITNIFWVDGWMKASYDDFGDVVSFDTTYRKNKENRPLALFVGVNHHKQTVVFGAALLYDETIPSFEWLFDTFASIMGGKKPVTILTDEDDAMANALVARWPETHHKLCIWHIYQNATIHLSDIFEKHEKFAHDFGRCIYDIEEEDEFLYEWNEMLVKYDLLENVWLKRLFRVKEKWALVYDRQFFCADITSTQRNESIHKVIKKYVSSNNNLRIFFKVFEKLIEYYRFEELNADFEASTSAQVVPIQLLKHAASLYTPEVFKDFQNELWKAFDCTGVLRGAYGTVAEYHVSYLGRTKPHVVKYNSGDGTVSCSCKKFEFGGLLCFHALKILTNNNILEIPKQYVLKRWTKSAKVGCLPGRIASLEDPRTKSSTRGTDLSLFFNKLVTRASETKESYELMKRIFVKTLERVDQHLHSRKVVCEGSCVRDICSCNKHKSGLEKNSKKRNQTEAQRNEVLPEPQPFINQTYLERRDIALQQNQAAQHQNQVLTPIPSIHPQFPNDSTSAIKFSESFEVQSARRYDCFPCSTPVTANLGGERSDQTSQQSDLPEQSDLR